MEVLQKESLRRDLQILIFVSKSSNSRSKSIRGNRPQAGFLIRGLFPISSRIDSSLGGIRIRVTR